MKIIIIAGSNRKSATSTRLAEHIQLLTQRAGNEVKLFDLYQLPIPFYSPDEAYANHTGLQSFKNLVLEADAIVLTTPEYHSSISGVLKNALDHLGQEHFEHKAVLSVSSAGGSVAVSSLTQLQAIVRNLHGINCPDWISIGGAQRKGFETSSANNEIEPDVRVRIQRVVEAFLELAELLKRKK